MFRQVVVALVRSSYLRITDFAQIHHVAGIIRSPAGLRDYMMDRDGVLRRTTFPAGSEPKQGEGQVRQDSVATSVVGSVQFLPHGRGIAACHGLSMGGTT